LRAEADAPIGGARGHRVGDQPSLVHQPGQTLIVARAHRTAHRHDSRELPPVWQGITLIDHHAVELGTPGEQLVLVGGGRLAGDVLEHQQRG